MTDAVKVAIITATASLFAGGVSASFTTFFASRITKSIQEIHVSLNSRLTALIKASHASGRIEEQNDQRARDEKEK